MTLTREFQDTALKPPASWNPPPILAVKLPEPVMDPVAVSIAVDGACDDLQQLRHTQCRSPGRSYGLFDRSSRVARSRFSR